MMRSLLLLLIIVVLATFVNVYAAPLKMLSAEKAGMADAEFGIGCSLGCAVGWDVRASSSLKPQGRISYDVNNLNDSKLDSAWVAANGGIGDYVEFVFEKKHFQETKETTFWGLDIINGYIKSEKAWRENARVKKLRMVHNGKPLYDIMLYDSMEIQSVHFSPFTIRPGSIVRLVILETYPGTKYQDVAITEIVPHGAH